MRYLILSLSFLISCSTVKPIQEQPDRLLVDIKTLSADEYEGRKTGSKGNDMARKYIIDRFKELGLKSNENIDYTQDFVIKNKDGKSITGHNVIGMIPGKKTDAIVISAHYDHIGIINNKIYNGADDNASGVAALLQYAEYFSKNKPQHTLIFAAFDAEESGLKGAKAFVENPPVEVSKIIMNINMDMISHNDKGELYAVGTFLYPDLKKFLVITNPNIKVLTGHDDPKLGKDDWTNQSDQAAFNNAKIPFLYFGVEDHKDYHQSTDKFENINKEFFINAAGAILEIIKNIDQERVFRRFLKRSFK